MRVTGPGMATSQTVDLEAGPLIRPFGAPSPGEKVKMIRIVDNARETARRPADDTLEGAGGRRVELPGDAAGAGGEAAGLDGQAHGVGHAERVARRRRCRC